MQIWEVYTGKRTQKKTDSDLPQQRRRLRRKLIPYICDFSRGVLNTRSTRSYPTLAPRPQI